MYITCILYSSGICSFKINMTSSTENAIHLLVTSAVEIGSVYP